MGWVNIFLKRNSFKMRKPTTRIAESGNKKEVVECVSSWPQKLLAFVFRQWELWEIFEEFLVRVGGRWLEWDPSECCFWAPLALSTKVVGIVVEETFLVWRKLNWDCIALSFVVGKLFGTEMRFRSVTSNRKIATKGKSWLWKTLRSN